jgi:Gpi18-like mannosyltransferase
MQILALWLLLRILTSIWAAVVSPMRPLTPIEQSIALWPPAVSFDEWLERVFLAPWLRWDAGWYQKIVLDGYQQGIGTAQFHPLYPWIASLFHIAGIHPIASLLLVSSIATLLFLLAFERLARLDISDENTRTSLFLLLAYPVSFVLFAPYSESLFLLSTALCLWNMRQKNWLFAGLSGAIATLTRQQGIFLLIPMAWEIWKWQKQAKPKLSKKWQGWLSLFLVLCGWSLWSIYRAWALNDLNFNFSSFQKFVYSVLISPQANQVVTVQEFLWPWQALQIALSKFWQFPDLDMSINLVLAGVFIIGFLLSWRNLHPSYRLYCVAIVLISLSYYTGPTHPYMGLPRHLLLAFPVFIGLAPLIKRPWQRLSILGVGIAGMLFLLLQYILEAWVP